MCNISPQINHILLNLYAKWFNIRRIRMDLQSNWFDWPWSVCTYKLSLARYKLLYKRHATRLLHLPLTQTHNSRSRRIYGHRVENTFPKNIHHDSDALNEECDAINWQRQKQINLMFDHSSKLSIRFRKKR